jgi:gamma-D-glutamyl-L-lysine dipeptidyl-peptidase
MKILQNLLLSVLLSSNYMFAQNIQYGICHLNLIPLRTTPAAKSELCTQLVFGDTYHLVDTSDNQKWFKIHNHYDDYEGWMEAGQYFAITETDLQAIQKNNQTVSTDLVAWVKNGEQRFPIVLGSSLPFFADNQIKIGAQVFDFQGLTQNSLQKTDRDILLKTALQFLKTPYLWGGKSAFGTDCSGFTQQVFKANGIKIKRDAYQQAEQGKEVKDLSQSKTGDLAFFVNSNGRVIHVGIIIESNKFPDLAKKHALKTGERLIIHALDCVRIDKLDNKGIYNLDRNYYSHNLKLIKRYEESQ